MQMKRLKVEGLKVKVMLAQGHLHHSNINFYFGLSITFTAKLACWEGKNED